MLPPRYLWLLLPLSCWCGYMTAPGTALAATTGQAAGGAGSTATSRVLAWGAELSKATAADLEKELRAVLAEPDSADKTRHLKLICARWAELDPRGALAWCEANQADPAVRLRILTEWALLDSEAAWQAIAAGKEGDNERSEVIHALLNEDPETFMGWFRQMPRSVLADGSPAWLALAERHEKELLEIANGLKQPPNGDFWAAPMFALLARVKALHDPAGTLEWAAKLEPANAAAAAVKAALEAWADKDPRAVWEKLDSGKIRSSVESQVGQSVLERLFKEDPAATIGLLRAATDTEALSRRNAVEAVREAFPALIASGKLKPVDAYRLIDSVKGGHSFLALNTMNEVFRALPMDQLAAAARAIAAEPPGDYRGVALGSIASAWLRKDPAAAVDFISAIPDADLRAKTYAGSFDRPGGGFLEPELLARAVAGIPAADRARAFAEGMSGYGDYFERSGSGQWSGPKFQPDSLAAAFKDLPPSAEANRVVTMTAQEWGRSDPAAALAWADQLQDPAARSAAYAGTFQTWAARKPNDAAGWLADKPAGPERDAAALPVVNNLANADAEIAWEWAGSIGNAGMREDARLTALKAWAARDPQAAQAAFRQISRSLTAAEAAKLSACLGGG